MYWATPYSIYIREIINLPNNFAKVAASGGPRRQGSGRGAVRAQSLGLLQLWEMG